MSYFLSRTFNLCASFYHLYLCGNSSDWINSITIINWDVRHHTIKIWHWPSIIYIYIYIFIHPIELSLPDKVRFITTLCQMHFAYRKWILLSRSPLLYSIAPSVMCHIQSNTPEHKCSHWKVIDSIGFVPTERSYSIGYVFRGASFRPRLDTTDIPGILFKDNVKLSPNIFMPLFFSWSRLSAMSVTPMYHDRTLHIL
jgi:hypothetical protein